MPLPEEVLQQVEMWKHLTWVDKHGDRFHGVWCGGKCLGRDYKGDDWLIHTLLSTFCPGSLTG